MIGTINLTLDHDSRDDLTKTKNRLDTILSTSIGIVSYPYFTDHYPRQIYSKYIDLEKDYPDFDIKQNPELLNGDITDTKKPWSSLSFSHLFEDITGVNEITKNPLPPPKNCPTKFKVFHTKTHLFFAAEMIAKDREVVATFKQRNDPIFQQDSDIEIFLDPYKSTHNYKEFESNGINTVWNLLLTKPYSDGGQEKSGRVTIPSNNSSDIQNWFDMPNQRTGVHFYKGGVNGQNSSMDNHTQSYGENQWNRTQSYGQYQSMMVTEPSTIQVDDGIDITNGIIDKDDTGVIMPLIPSKQDNDWSIEVVYTFEEILKEWERRPKKRGKKILKDETPPWHDTFWKLALSRVEDKGEKNWVWQPQLVYVPEQQTFAGKISMHEPEAWGYLKMGGIMDMGGITTVDPPVDLLFPLRLACAVIYHSQQSYKGKHGKYANSLSQLGELVNVKSSKKDAEVNAFWNIFDVDINTADSHVDINTADSDVDINNADSDVDINNADSDADCNKEDTFQASVAFNTETLTKLRSLLKENTWTETEITNSIPKIFIRQDRLMW